MAPRCAARAGTRAARAGTRGIIPYRALTARTCTRSAPHEYGLLEQPPDAYLARALRLLAGPQPAPLYPALPRAAPRPTPAIPCPPCASDANTAQPAHPSVHNPALRALPLLPPCAPDPTLPDPPLLSPLLPPLHWHLCTQGVHFCMHLSTHHSIPSIPCHSIPCPPPPPCHAARQPSPHPASLPARLSRLGRRGDVSGRVT